MSHLVTTQLCLLSLNFSGLPNTQISIAKLHNKNDLKNPFDCSQGLQKNIAPFGIQKTFFRGVVIINNFLTSSPFAAANVRQEINRGVSFQQFFQYF